jgi:hypothetical protein
VIKGYIIAIYHCTPIYVELLRFNEIVVGLTMAANKLAIIIIIDQDKEKSWVRDFGVFGLNCSARKLPDI